jgi:hypothetical protein
MGDEIAGFPSQERDTDPVTGKRGAFAPRALGHARLGRRRGGCWLRAVVARAGPIPQLVLAANRGFRPGSL